MSQGDAPTWIARLQEGDEAAAQELWEEYFRRLARLARKKLEGLPRRAADEDDVANSALKSFLLGARRGQFPRITDRDNLWALLVLITARKASELKRHERRAKRGRGKVRGESALVQDAASQQPGIDHCVASAPTPEFVAQVAEEFRRRLESLQNEDLKRIALWKMENFTNDEIAEKQNCSRPTIERKLRLIRTIWENATIK